MGEGEEAPALGVVPGEAFPLGFPHCGEQVPDKTKTVAKAAAH